MSFKLSTGNSVNTSSSASVSANTDTTATVKVTVGAGITNGYVQSTGVVAKIWINGSHVDTKTVFGNGTYTTAGMHYVDASKAISKSASSKSVAWKVEYWQYTDGYEQTLKQTDSGSITISGITYYAPNAPSGLTSTRESDNKNVLSWTAPSTSTTKPVTAILIERQVDGGSWSQIASVSGTATSYNDTATSADHSYVYRIRSQNSAGYSSYVTSGTTYNTPAAPTKVTASRLAETTVKLEIANAANTATALEIQRSTDAATWETVATVEGSPVTETTDEPGGGTFYYRARNTRGDLASDWSPASNAVVTICAPAAPTLKAPASGVVVNKANESVTFEWAHNPIDGSSQTAAKLRYSTDKGSTYTEVAIEGDAASFVLANVFAVNSEVTWGVCTKGAHADYGPWSDNRVFYVYQAPSVAFAQPTDGFVVENTPIAIQLQYDDPSGTLASAVMNISDGSKTVYTRNMGTDTSCEIQNTEWTPDNGKVYTLTVQVRSSSSLSASATREITVDFVLPQPAAVHIENDPETGYVSLVVYVEEMEESAPSSITWDGDTTGLEGIEAYGLYKASDLIPSSDSIIGQTVTVVDASGSSVTELSSDMLYTDLAEGTYYFASSGDVPLPILLVGETSFTIEGVTCSAGIYFCNYTVLLGETLYISELTLPSVELAEPKSISVWRESDDGRVLLGEKLQAGAGLVDRYAPLNADYGYIVTSFADSGAANSQEFANRINSLWWFVYFDGGMAKAMWEPSGSRSSRRTKDELKERDGSEWPVLIQGKNKSHKVDFSGWVETKEEADAFEDMTLASGGKVYKGLKGEVFHCHAEADITDSYEYGDDSADVKVSITRVRGGAL